MLGRRVRFLRLALVVVLVLVTGRLVDVQVFRSGHYRAAASQELTTVVPIPALRGGIFDRNGQVLAASVPTDDIVADDFQIAHPETEAFALTGLLGVPVSQLAVELHRPSGYVVLAKQLGQQRAQQIAAANFPGITLLPDATRLVPNGALASPIVGVVNGQGVGAGGIEYGQNRLLAGQSGSETIFESPLGVSLPQSPVTHTPSVRGTGLELTLDNPLQYQAEQDLSAAITSSHAQSGIAIVMDVRTGDILAMANLAAAGSPLASTTPVPGAGPPAPGTARVDEASSDIALTQLFEPGSVFKLVTFSAALSDHLINPNSVFTVPDQIQLDGSTFHDAEPHPTESLSATQILAQSSNVGTGEIAQGLGEQRLLDQVQRLGFGQPTGLSFPGESAGLLVGAPQWEPTDFISLPIGQVDAVNAQQVLDAYNAVADHGVFVPPRLVRAAVASNGQATALPRPPGRQVIDPATDAQLMGMLQQVVVQGTGTAASVPGYSVAGKTGTAQIPNQGKSGYVPGAYVATFVGAAPANNPVLSAIVVLNRPTPIFGGTVAAPVFSQIMSYALHRYSIPTSPGASTQVPSGSGAAQTQDIT